MKDTTEELVIKLSKTKIMLLTLGSFAFVAGSIWLWTIGDLYIKGISIIGILFFGLCGIYGLIKLLDSRPGLVINKEGLLDNSSAVSGHLIRWQDIKGFEVEEIKNTKLLFILVNDPQKFLENASRFNRFWMKMNLKTYGTPISISSNALQCNFDELLVMIENEMNRFAVKRE